MNDLETRAEQAFRDALSRQADAFETISLTPVRRESHARRIGLIAVAASLLLVLGTAVGVALWPRNSADRGPVEDTAGPAAGWRYESYRDVQIEVPVSWGYERGPRSDWCGGRDDRHPTEPYSDVFNRFDGVEAVGCMEEAPDPDLHGDGVPKRYWAPHVKFLDPELSAAVPDGTTAAGGWTRIVKTVGSTRVWVLADAEHLDEAGRIVESARVVTVDHSGCPVTSPIQAKAWVRPSEPFDVAAVDKVDSIAVCQYAMAEGTAKPGLLASRLLEGAAADDLLDAIKAAPVGGGPNAPENCLHEPSPNPAEVLRLTWAGSTGEIYVYNRSCVNNGFDDGTHRRELTRDACPLLWDGRVTYTSASSGPHQRCVLTR